MKRVRYERSGKHAKEPKLTDDGAGLEEEILAKVNIDDSGQVIYDGRGSVAERTGSAIRDLIQYVLYRNGTKPIDTDIFIAHCQRLGIKLRNRKLSAWRQLPAK